MQLCNFSLVVRIDSQTAESHGCSPDARPTEQLINYGIVNLNKPKGPSSHETSEFVRKLLGIGSAGHSGTLDPAVTGVLPVALGRATRIVQALLPAGKEYVGIMHLHGDVAEQLLRKTIKEFTGKIAQLPPVRSAVVRRLREREVYFFDILELEGRDVLFRTGVQAGTYIRKLVHDVGSKLGINAHMTQLVRTRAGPYLMENSVTLHDLEDGVYYWKSDGNDKLLRKCILPIETAVQHLPKIWIQDSAVDALCHGAMLNVPGIVKFEVPFEKTVAILTLKGELVALGEAQMTSEQLSAAEKGLAVKTRKVFMLPGTYPKFEKGETVH